VVIANFGCAGVKAGLGPLGSPWLINKLVHESTGAAIYPERLIAHSWPEQSCLTVEKPAVLATFPEVGSTLFDMEAFAVFSAAQRYVSTSQMVAGKVVSDHLSDDRVIDWEHMVTQLEQPYREACHTFKELLESHRDCLHGGPRRARAEQARHWWETTLAALGSAVPLTVSQSRQLEGRLRAFALGSDNRQEMEAKSEELEDLVKRYSGESKIEHRAIHAQILERLLTPPLFSRRQAGPSS
jgi:hypothetical protein